MIGGIKRGYHNIKDLLSVLVPAAIEGVKAIVANKPIEPPMPPLRPPPSHSRAVEAMERDRKRAREAIDRMVDK